MKDITGKTLKPGQKIAYAASNGRSAALRLATVLRIEKRLKSSWDESGPYIEKARVQPLTGHWYSINEPLKETTLQYGERIVIIEK